MHPLNDNVILLRAIPKKHQGAIELPDSSLTASAFGLVLAAEDASLQGCVVMFNEHMTTPLQTSIHEAPFAHAIRREAIVARLSPHETENLELVFPEPPAFLHESVRS